MKINAIKFTNINVDNAYKNKKVELEPRNNKDSYTVQISELGQYLNKVNTEKEGIDIDKINDIKKRIENGTYKIDSKDLAKKIIEKMNGDYN